MVLNTNLNVANQANIYAPKTAGVVSDAELTNVAKDILATAPGRTNSNHSISNNYRANVNPEVKFFQAGYDINAVRQAATNQTGFNVNLSQNAINAINVLNSQAAQAHNTARAVDGKIHINSEKVDASESKNLFAGSANTDVEVFNSTKLTKDRRGPGGFYIPQEENNEEQEKKGLNLVI